MFAAQHAVERLAGDLAGLPRLTPGRQIQVKPYLVARTVRAAEAGASFARGADVGMDLKYGVSPSLTLDATVNPDFAQVEADDERAAPSASGGPPCPS